MIKMGSNDDMKLGPRRPSRRKATYVAAFLFSFAYLCLLIFAPGFRRGGRKVSAHSASQQQMLATELLTMGRFDTSAKYRVLSFVLTGSRWSYFSRNSSLCIASQMTLDEIDLLVPFVTAAPGAVSVAISLAREEILSALNLLKYLRLCSASLREKASIHFLVPHGPDFDQNHVRLGASLNCHQKASEMLHLLTANREFTQTRPPAGLLRNVALEHCHNEWRASIDPHMLFPEKANNPLENYRKFLASKSGEGRSAFILAEYELIRGILPENKAELLSHLLDRKVKARGDYSQAYASSKLDQWQKFKSSSSKLIYTAYKVEKFSFGYQPAVITKKDVPLFDERYTENALAKFSQVRSPLVNDL